MINTVSITDLKQNTASVIKGVKGSREPLLIMQRSQPAAVILDPKNYEMIERALEDLEDLKAIEERKNEPTVPFERVVKKLASKK